MKRFLIKTALVMILTFVMAAPVQATLYYRGTGTGMVQGYEFGSCKLIYDDDLNITWYDYSKSVNNWDNQISWAGDLTVTLNGTTFNDWRLPTALSPDGNLDNVVLSEMGHLYYIELQNGGWGYLKNTDPFEQLVGDWYYSDTEYSDSAVWKFNFASGEQAVGDRYGTVLALAVRDGDVAASNSVPEPSILTLLAFGLAGIIGVGRKFRR